MIEEDDIDAYLNDGSLPDACHYIAVPAGKVVRRRAFWITPKHKFHNTANCFLVSTDVYEMNADEFDAERHQTYCFIADEVRTLYIGTLDRSAHGADRILSPLNADDFPPLAVAGLRCIGRVIASF